jgi:hypothetical protein
MFCIWSAGVHSAVQRVTGAVLPDVMVQGGMEEHKRSGISFMIT